MQTQEGKESQIGQSLFKNSVRLIVFGISLIVLMMVEKMQRGMFRESSID
jgi:hypothetical protein